MRGDRSKRVSEQIQQIAAEFFSKEANRSALITVTKVTISKDFKQATIYFTVMPEEREDAALSFAKRHGKEFRTFAKKQLSLRNVPFFEFKIDHGEKNFYSILEEI